MLEKTLRSPTASKTTKAAGLQHILKRHEVYFTNKGIRRKDIANVVINAIENGKIIEGSGSVPLYLVSQKGVEQHIAIGVGSDGFIIRANPVAHIGCRQFQQA